ncbi:MAG: major capsid protein [Vulcanibacillus sp.]
MPKTQIADIIVPEVFNPYVIQKTAELSALSQAGIISNNPELDALATAGGKLINMPFWNDLSGDDEVLTDDGALTPEKITTGQDVAALFMRGKAWSVNDLAKALSGDDPMAAIGSLVAEYWARRRQALLFSILKGIFASASMSGNLHDISALSSGAELISGSTFIDATQKMGDAKERLTAVGMHSAVVSYLAKQDLIETIPDSEGKPTIKVFQGKRVIEDDGCPVSNGVYASYLFGKGAIGLGNGSAPVPTETDRDTLAGDDILINRQHFVLHPRGVKFTNTSVVGSSPTNAECETAANWSRVYENKNIRIVKFVHKIG